MSVSQRKKAIEAIKEETSIRKALDYLLMSSEERSIYNLENQLKLKERDITLVQQQIDDIAKLNRVEEKRIDSLQRQNEIDNRQIEIRQKSLDELSKKEDDVNKIYDARFEALDKVSRINDRVAQQQEDRISLATALTSGDIAGAASAAARMSENTAASTVEDTRIALEERRQRELESLTISVNGLLLNRSQIELEIENINTRIYNRNLQIRDLEDTMFNRKQNQILPLEEQMNSLNEDRIRLARELETEQYNNWLKEKARIEEAIRMYGDLNNVKSGGSSSSSGGGSGSSGSSSSSGGGSGSSGSSGSSGGGSGSSGTSSRPSITVINPQFPTVNASNIMGSGTGPTYTNKDVPKMSSQTTTLGKNNIPVLGTSSGMPMLGSTTKTNSTYVAPKVIPTPLKSTPTVNYSQGVMGSKGPTLPPVVKKKYMGGVINKYAMGGYVPPQTPPPPKKMNFGSMVPGIGNIDKVPALLTPGEFVIRKSVAQANMPLLKALNSDVFPSMSLNTPDVAPTVTSSTNTINNNTPVYNYSISVNVPNTTASPDEIANVVVSRIKRSMDTNIRSSRY
jgi:hypothetical protein